MSAYTELSNEQLEALPTDRLYTIYKLYRKKDLHNANYYDDWRDGFDRNEDTIRIHSKCVFIKSILDKRGHIPREKESKKKKTPPHLAGRCRWMEQLAEDRITRPYISPGVVLPKEQQGTIKDPDVAIGKQVYKVSKKKFKSKNLYNTVKSVTTNIHTGRVAFDFEEDSSVVDAHQCHLRKAKKRS